MTKNSTILVTLLTHQHFLWMSFAQMLFVLLSMMRDRVRYDSSHTTTDACLSGPLDMGWRAVGQSPPTLLVTRSEYLRDKPVLQAMVSYFKK